LITKRVKFGHAYNLQKKENVCYLLLTARIALTPMNRTFCFCCPGTRKDTSKRLAFSCTLSGSL